jgi:hypothetical protein
MLRITYDIQIATIVTVGLDNKGDLLKESGKTAKGLIDIDRCDKVVIIWDLIPPDSNSCLIAERDIIKASLQGLGISRKVELVCIIRELEAWLICDERAINAQLSTPENRVNISRRKRTERISNPKKELNRIFQKNGAGPYIDYFHAETIVKQFPNLKRIQKCATFQRFAKKAIDIDVS